MEKDYGKRFKRAKKDGNDDGGQLHLGYVYDILDKGWIEMYQSQLYGMKKLPNKAL